MPKDGYTSITLPDWFLTALDSLMNPGQTIQSYILNSVLVPQIPKEQLQKFYDTWTAKHYPYGGMKPLG